MTERTKTIEHPTRWKIVLDASQVIPDDPGEGTPAMVYGPQGQSGTYYAVYENEEIGDRDGNAQRIPRDIARWLDAQYDEVEAFLMGDDDRASPAP